ncbi:DUF1269 domain-containing protein [Solirubrobacter deserti]|uniref:DUF1269 domain-containing protein n=1 Tax=Solirubrobacter deserti TaxID=2282478 RepID=A0ABT4RVD7_9ACTN|nr:DUF1269 domain-containing protein [Solirubrobacter deserti]MDA0142564.1 DUF1269 domain-containing protein [Solirubrobacter deserti]
MIGGAAGATHGALADHGLDAAFMRDLGNELRPGSAALILLVRGGTLDKVLARIEDEGRVLRTSLDAETERRLSEALAGAG